MKKYRSISANFNLKKKKKKNGTICVEFDIAK